MKSYKVSVINELNGRRFQALFESSEQAQSWIASQVSKNSWGKSERWVRTEDLASELEDRVLETRLVELGLEGEDSVEESLVKADYVITEEDLTNDSDWMLEQVLLKRQAEYAKLDSMFLEALAEKENGCPEKMDEYLALREQIKLDNPKP